MLRSLVFFIREGHVQRTSEDKQLLVRDSELVDIFQLAIKKSRKKLYYFDNSRCYTVTA